MIGWAFVVLTLGSLIWIAIGYVSGEYALMAQNIVLTLINLFGIYRWLIWKGKIDPGKVFDLTLPLADVAEGYRAMDERRAIKTLLTV